MGRERRERDRSVSRADGGDRLRVVYECLFPGEEFRSRSRGNSILTRRVASSDAFGATSSGDTTRLFDAPLVTVRLSTIDSLR